MNPLDLIIIDPFGVVVALLLSALLFAVRPEHTNKRLNKPEFRG